MKEFFKNYKVEMGKLAPFGFTNKGEVYTYSQLIADKQFEMHVTIDKMGGISTKVMELAIDEEYTLHLVADAIGGFVGKIRSEYEKVLADIREKCFEKHVFKSQQAQAVIGYVRDKYNDELEYLWEKFPSNAIWRRKDNNKWYGALLIVKKNKLGLKSDEEIEILDLRIDSALLEKIVDHKKYFEGYHMNKKHWFTICLDNSLTLEEIFDWIDKSYALAKK